jgi:hypothetical protein
MQTMHIGIGFDRLFGNILSAGIYELESWDHGWLANTADRDCARVT